MYNPEERGTIVPLRVVGMAAALILVVVVAAVAARLIGSSSGDDGARSGLAVEPVDFERGITDLGDGWTRIEIDEGAITIELPGPLLRTRDDLLIGDFGKLPMAVWGGGEAGEEVYGVAVADLPDGWRDRTDDLLRTVPLPVGVDVLENRRSPTTVTDWPAVEIEANGPDGQVRAVVVATDDQLITLVYGSRSPAGTGSTITRMLGSLRLT